MPILAVDQFGRLYSTSPDREDGLGFGDSPDCVPQGDLTLGSAYLKSQAQRTRELLKNKSNRDIEDARAAQAKAFGAMERQKAMEASRRRNYLMSQPGVQVAAYKQAIAMGCQCEYSTPMSGNVMTANGQSGARGMTRDELTIHNAITGRGPDTSFGVDPVEAHQHRERAEAQRILRLKARR